MSDGGRDDGGRDDAGRDDAGRGDGGRGDGGRGDGGDGDSPDGGGRPSRDGSPGRGGDGGDGSGRLFDTYVAALQHEKADLPPGTRLVGVVRRPTRWFRAAVDENEPALGPPEAVLDSFQARREELEASGRGDRAAHNDAWADLGFAEQYRDHLDAGAAAEAVEELLWRLDAGEDLALVCYENTDHKRCHRTVLKEHMIAER